MVGCLLGWKIIFHDGTRHRIVSSKDMAWNDAPAIDVQYVILYYASHKELQSGRDDYNLPDILGLEGSVAKRGSQLDRDKWVPLKQIIVDDEERFG